MRTIASLLEGRPRRFMDRESLNDLIVHSVFEVDGEARLSRPYSRIRPGYNLRPKPILKANLFSRVSNVAGGGLIWAFGLFAKMKRSGIWTTGTVTRSADYRSEQVETEERQKEKDSPRRRHQKDSRSRAKVQNG